MLKNIYSSLIVFVLIISLKSYGTELTYPSDITPFQKRQVEFFWEHVEELKRILNSVMRNDKSGHYITQLLENYIENQEVLKDITPLFQSINTRREKIQVADMSWDAFKGTVYESLELNHTNLNSLITQSLENLFNTQVVAQEQQVINGQLYLDHLGNILRIYSQQNIKMILQDQLSAQEYNQFKEVLDAYLQGYKGELNIKDYTQDIQEIAKTAEEQGDKVIMFQVFPMLPHEVKRELLGDEIFKFLQEYELSSPMEAQLFMNVVNPKPMIRMPKDVE